MSFLSSSVYTGYTPVCQFSLPAETVRHIWLPLRLSASTIVCDKRLPAKTVCMILLPAETLGRKQNHADSLCRKPNYVDSLCRKPFFIDCYLGKKQGIQDSPSRNQI